MAESHFNVWDETVEHGNGNQSRAAVAAFNDDGYVFTRIDPSNFRFYYGDDGVGFTSYNPSFVIGAPDFTRRYPFYVTDSAIGSHILFSFVHEGKAHFVTGDASDTSVTVVVFSPSWTTLGKYTVSVGHDCHDLQWHFDHLTGTVHFVEATPTYVDATSTLTSFVGYYAVPATADRYPYYQQGGSSYGVYPAGMNDSPVSVTATTATHNVSLTAHPTGTSGYTVNSVEHASQTAYWGFYFNSWTHDIRRVWYNGTLWRSSVDTVLLSVDDPYTIGNGSSTFVAGRGYLHDEDVYYRWGGSYYVKFTATRWEFYSYSVNNPSLDLETWVDYPITPSRVLLPSDGLARGRGISEWDSEIVGPVVEFNGQMQLLVLQLLPWEYPANEPFVPQVGSNALAGDGELGDGTVAKFAVDLDASPLVHDLSTSATTYDVTYAVTRPVIDASDIGTKARFGAAVSFYADDPVNAEAPDVEHLAFVSLDGEATEPFPDFDDVTGEGAGGSLAFDTEGDGDVTLTTETNVNADLVARFDTSADATVVVSSQQNPTQDVDALGDLEADGAVLVLSDYEDEDVLALNEPQLVFAAALSILEDYEDEVLTCDFGSVEQDALVAVHSEIVFGDVTINAALDMGVVALVGAEGYSEGTPPPPGTCSAGTYTVTLPAGADPGEPLVYLVDGRLVQVLHGGVVLDTFYLPTPDLDEFCVTVLSSSGVPLTGLPDPVVTPVTPDSYRVATGAEETDLFMRGEGDFVGRVLRGPSLLVSADSVIETWDVVSPDDFGDEVTVLQFGYEYPVVDFVTAARIAEAGFGRYLLVP